MDNDRDITVVYANGVLRPETPLNLPENSRMRIAIRRFEVTPQQEERGRAVMDDLRHRGVIRLGGWRPTREELHERR